MRRVRFRDEAAQVEKDGVVGPGLVRLDLGQDGVEQIGVMNLRIENLRRRPAHFARDQVETALGVNGRLVFRKDDQGWATLVEARVHPGGDLHSASEGESNVHPVAHLVGGECALDFLNQLLVRRNIREGERGGGTPQSLEMFVQLENAAVIESQPFPNRIAALDRGIEWTHSRLVAMHEPAVDVHDQVAVLFVELL